MKYGQFQHPIRLNIYKLSGAFQYDFRHCFNDDFLHRDDGAAYFYTIATPDHETYGVYQSERHYRHGCMHRYNGPARLEFADRQRTFEAYCVNGGLAWPPSFFWMFALLGKWNTFLNKIAFRVRHK